MRTDGGSRPDVLDRRALRRHALSSLLLSTLAATAIVVAYFVLPFTSPLAADSIAEMVGGLIAVAALLVWQIREIIRSSYPTVRAISALEVTLPLFLVVFSTTYFLLARAHPSWFSEPLTRLDAAYFTVTVFATVGFGDITAVSETARAVTTGQMLGDILLVGLIARVVVGAVQEARGRRDSVRPE